MGGRTSDWKEELGRFLKPFLARLGHKARRQMCPLHVSGLIGPGDRAAVTPSRLTHKRVLDFILSVPDHWAVSAYSSIKDMLPRPQPKP
jgi:hypothetical protein